MLVAAAPLLQGVARILCGDLDGGDASLEDAVSAGQELDAHENLAFALCEAPATKASPCTNPPDHRGPEPAAGRGAAC